MQSTKFIIQAHRGACHAFMENSLPAFSEALRLEAHSIELDVQLTSDERIAVVHDDVLSPDVVTTAQGVVPKQVIVVANTSLSELQTLNLSLLRRIKLPRRLSRAEMKIPSLTEVIELILREKRESFLWLDIEMKIPETKRGDLGFRAKFIEALLREVSPYRKRLPMVVRSFDWELLSEFRLRDPKFHLGLLSDPGQIPDSAILGSVQPYLWAPCLKNLNGDSVRAIGSKGILVIPWTINEEADLRWCLKWKADGLTTDDPSLIFHWIPKEGAKN